LSQAVQEALGVSINKAKRLIAQSRSKKTQDKQPKLYSWHAPEVECISKGNSRNPYKFGVKVGIATTLKGTLIVGARAFPGNPYDGYTLNEQVEQATILMQALGTKPQTAFVDMGYRGVDKDNLGLDIKHRGKSKSLTDEEKKSLKKATSNRAGHRPLESGSPDEPVPPQGINWRQFACGPVRCRLQHPLVAADDCQKGHRPFFAPATGQRLGAHWLSIARDFYRQIGHAQRNSFSAVMKINFSGTTE
jgi:hypothetical protein